MSFRQGRGFNYTKKADLCLCEHPELTHYTPGGGCVVAGCGCMAFKSSGSKHGNRHVRCQLEHGHDSGFESIECGYLQLRKKAGDIIDFQFHPVEELFGQNGSKIGTYEVDFLVQLSPTRREFIEVKGQHLIRDMGFRLKWALLVDKYKDDSNYTFRIVTK